MKALRTELEILARAAEQPSLRRPMTSSLLIVAGADAPAHDTQTDDTVPSAQRRWLRAAPASRQPTHY